MAALRVAAETGHLQRYSSINYPDSLNPRALQLARFLRDRRHF
jgi:hypothetical protein